MTNYSKAAKILPSFKNGVLLSNHCKNVPRRYHGSLGLTPLIPYCVMPLVVVTVFKAELGAGKKIEDVSFMT